MKFGQDSNSISLEASVSSSFLYWPCPESSYPEGSEVATSCHRDSCTELFGPSLSFATGRNLAVWLCFCKTWEGSCTFTSILTKQLPESYCPKLGMLFPSLSPSLWLVGWNGQNALRKSGPTHEPGGRTSFSRIMWVPWYKTKKKATETSNRKPMKEPM